MGTTVAIPRPFVGLGARSLGVRGSGCGTSAQIPLIEWDQGSGLTRSGTGPEVGLVGLSLRVFL